MFLVLLIVLGVFGWRTFDPPDTEHWSDDPHLKKPKSGRRSEHKEIGDSAWWIPEKDRRSIRVSF